MSKPKASLKAIPFTEDDEVTITRTTKVAPKGFMADTRRTTKDPLPEPTPKRFKPGDPLTVITSAAPSDPPAAVHIWWAPYGSLSGVIAPSRYNERGVAPLGAGVRSPFFPSVWPLV